MSKVPGFHILNDKSIGAIVDKMGIEKYGGSDLSTVICKEGDTADRLFIIMEGKVEIIVNDSVVRQMGELDFFGESSLIIENHERGATVNALTKTCDGINSKVTMLTLRRESFQSLLKDGIITSDVESILKDRHIKWQQEDESRLQNNNGGETGHVSK